MQICIHQCQGLRRKMMNVQFCLRDEFGNWFCYLFRLTSRQYEKYLCMYIRIKKKIMVFSYISYLA